MPMPACVGWPASPNLTEACDAIRRIVRDGNRAADVILRMRAFFKKAPTAKELIDINETIQEVLAVTESELREIGYRCGLNSPRTYQEF